MGKIESLRPKLERGRDQRREPERSREASKRDTCARHGFLDDSCRRRYWALPRCLAQGFTAREGLLGAVASPPPPPPPLPPHLSQGGWNGNGARGLFEAVEWKIDFNPLCGDKGARSALPDQGSGRSGGPVPRPGLESLQTHAARGPSGLAEAQHLSAHPSCGIGRSD